jgi:hypothetical protein
LLGFGSGSVGSVGSGLGLLGGVFGLSSQGVSGPGPLISQPSSPFSLDSPSEGVISGFSLGLGPLLGFGSGSFGSGGFGSGGVDSSGGGGELGGELLGPMVGFGSGGFGSVGSGLGLLGGVFGLSSQGVSGLGPLISQLGGLFSSCRLLQRLVPSFSLGPDPLLGFSSGSVSSGGFGSGGVDSGGELLGPVGGVFCGQKRSITLLTSQACCSSVVFGLALSCCGSVGGRPGGVFGGGSGRFSVVSFLDGSVPLDFGPVSPGRSSGQGPLGFSLGGFS